MTLAEAIEYIRNNEAYAAAQAGLAEVCEVVGLAAHPKFTTVDGRIVYYLTKSDIEAARALYEKLRTDK